MIPVFRIRLLWTLLLTGGWGACVGEDIPRSNAGGDEIPPAHPHEEVVNGSGVNMPAWVSEPGGLTLFEHVTTYARLRAQSDYRAPTPIVSRSLSDLTYVQHRSIAFRSDRAIWREELPFEVQLFHPGGGNNDPVQIHLVEDGRDSTIAFDPTLFEYGDELRGLDL